MSITEYKTLITDYVRNNYKLMFREPEGIIKYKFMVPGSTYNDCVWDWDSWLADVAIRQFMSDEGIVDESFCEYEKGCILNFLDHMLDDGRMGIFIVPDHVAPEFDKEDMINIHKPCLAQHAVFVIRTANGDAEWLRPHYSKMKTFIEYYNKNFKHKSGLYFWYNDSMIGVDNDPCTFFRPDKSSGSIYLNALMYKELLAMAELAEIFDIPEDIKYYGNLASKLKDAINSECWDERNGFYYSVDLNLLEFNPEKPKHKGCPIFWNTLIQRIDVWSGFIPMWAGIPNEEQARRMVYENYKNERTFNAPYGVRTLSKQEKMYGIIKSGGPSCWLGPIWGISNYMTFAGLVKYGFKEEATELAEKTVKLFGEDVKKTGVFHEYYHPETGEPVMNPGFQNWNLFVLKMIAWLEGRRTIEEF